MERNCLALRDGAGDETRTRDIFLGKEVLYQLSYTRFRRKGGKVVGPLFACKAFLRPLPVSLR